VPRLVSHFTAQVNVLVEQWQTGILEGWVMDATGGQNYFETYFQSDPRNPTTFHLDYTTPCIFLTVIT
jgi:hypothetical protein